MFLSSHQKINAGNNKAFIGVGPYVGLGLSAQNKAGRTKYDLYEKNETANMLMERFGFGAQLMYGFNF